MHYQMAFILAVGIKRPEGAAKESRAEGCGSGSPKGWNPRMQTSLLLY
jgi:hypothetical protein